MSERSGVPCSGAAVAFKEERVVYQSGERWFDPLLFGSACGSVLGQDTELLFLWCSYESLMSRLALWIEDTLSFVC